MDDLVSQETVLLAAADYAEVIAVQQRTAPLVERLAALASTVDDAARAKIAAVVARRSRNLAALAERIEQTRLELSDLRASGLRVAKIAPVYGPITKPLARQLSAVG